MRVNALRGAVRTREAEQCTSKSVKNESNEEMRVRRDFADTENTERFANTKDSEESRLCVSAALRLRGFALTRLRCGARIERPATSTLPPRPPRSLRSLQMYHALKSRGAGFRSMRRSAIPALPFPSRLRTFATSREEFLRDFALTRLRCGARIEWDAPSTIPLRSLRSLSSLQMYHALNSRLRVKNSPAD